MKKRHSITGLLLYSYHATRGTTLLMVLVLFSGHENRDTLQ